MTQPAQSSSPSSSSSPSAILSQHIQTAALLHSHCYDISLTAFGRLYKLHRILLVQSSFFSTLLQGDFSERASYVVPDLPSASSSTLRLTFDDPNITRPAFEYCIAHLYGSAPQLVLPHWAIPTPAAPLSSAWTPSNPSPRPSTLNTSSAAELKAGSKECMPATPRFLLSLLATSIYLGIPSLSSAATTLILASFTPFTISTYLRFALGKPLIGAKEARQRIGSQDHLWDWELEGPCWGLDHIGVPHIDDEYDVDAAAAAHSSEQEEASHLPDDDEEAEKLTRRDRSASPQVSRRPAISRNATDTTPTGAYIQRAEPLLDYGQVAHRIAESSFCYLNRWGTDIAAVEQEKWEYDEAALEDWLLDTYQKQDEQQQQRIDDGPALISEAIAPYILPRGRVPSKVTTPLGGDTGGKSRASAPPPPPPLASRPKTVSHPQWDIPTPALCIFSHPRLSRLPFAADANIFDSNASTATLASFVHPKSPHATAQTSLGLPSNHLVSLLASDGFFVRNELQRYQVARGVVMMRRAQKALALEVEQWLPDDDGDDQDEEDGEEDGVFRGDTPPMPSTPKRTAGAARLSTHRTPSDTLDGNAYDEENDDDAHYAALFKHGIYYSHLSFGDLKRIAEEAQQYALAEASGGSTVDDGQEDDDNSGSPHDWSDSETEDDDDDDDEDDGSASQPFTSYLHKARTSRRRNRRQDARAAAAQKMLAPTDTLQAALWSGNELKNHILSSTASGAASLEAGFAPSPPNSVDADVTRRGLAFAADGNMLAADASAAVPTVHSLGVHDAGAGPSNQSNTAAGGHAPPTHASPPGASSDKDRDESFLGVTSSLKQFGQAYQQATRRGSVGGASFSSPRWTPRGGSRLMSTGDSPLRRKRSELSAGGASLAPSSSSSLASASSSPLTLGGLAHKTGPLTVASRGAGAKSLLNNRYFSIPVDDTVRYGEFFAGLLSGATWGSGNANAGGDSGGGARSDHPSVSSFEATGLAAFQDVHSLPPINGGPANSSNPSTKSTACLGDAPIFTRTDSFLVGGPFSDVKRTTDNLYGLRNKACKGRELGKLGSEVSHRKVALDGVLGSMGGARASSSIDSDVHSHTAGEEDEAQKSTPCAPSSLSDKRASSLEEESLLDTGIALAKLEHRKWTGFEPMRIGVEYYGIDRLEEKQRLYSPSFFYAGSVWILYVQIMKKPKGMQLGVYLHRHGPFEPLPVRSAPLSEVLRFYKRDGGVEGEDDANASTDTTSFLHTKDRSPTVPTHAASASSSANGTSTSNTTTTTNTTPRRPGTTTSTNVPTTSVDAQLSSSTSQLSTLTLSTTGPPTLPGQSPPIPYRDPRKSVRAFFSIHCYSPLGNSLTRFDSGPDKFSESQSWGWKSSSLMGVWTLPTGKREEGKSERCEGFRCVVCLGVI